MVLSNAVWGMRDEKLLNLATDLFRQAPTSEMTLVLHTNIPRHDTAYNLSGKSVTPKDGHRSVEEIDF